MPCEILIKTDVHGDGTVNYSTGDVKKDERGVYKKGYPVSIFDAPYTHRGYKEGLPYFCAVNVTDASAAEVEAMIASTFSEKRLNQSWIRQIDFATVNNDLVIDGWRIRVFTTNPGFSNLAGITQSMVENYLTKWYASVFSTATNEVIFDVAIFEDAFNNPGAIQSEGFWGIVPTFVFFNETSYVSETGIHTVEADYTASVFTSEQVQERVEERGGEVVSDISSVITFTIDRVDVFKWFQQEVKEAIENTIYRRQFRVPETTVDYIIANGTQIIVIHPRGSVEYRVLDRTLVQVESFLINKLDEDL
jgi:hypothetical protein